MEKKEDRRVRVTKRMLKDALIELLKTKDIYHISIRELCETADVNRTTFYKYYGNQFDLLSDMEDDLIGFISSTIEKNHTDSEKILTAACRYLEENLEFARLIINNNVDPAFPNRLFSADAVTTSFVNRYSPETTEEALEYFYNYITYGVYRVVCVWLNKENRESPEALAKLINEMVLR